MKKYIKYFIVLFVVFIVVLGLTMNDKKEYLSGKYKIEIKFKDYGTLDLELDANNAPITVTNFVNLVKDKFYDGLTIHRVVDGFMIQGGESDKATKTIKGEFSSNGVKNNISHERGVISMARSNDYNSASSQFFIMQEDNVSLDGLYASFGKVYKGIEVIDDIVSKVSEYGDDNGVLPEDKRPIIEYIKVID